MNSFLSNVAINLGPNYKKCPEFVSDSPKLGRNLTHLFLDLPCFLTFHLKWKSERFIWRVIIFLACPGLVPTELNYPGSLSIQGTHTINSLVGVGQIHFSRPPTGNERVSI